MRLVMASLLSPMCGCLAIVDNDGNGATGDKVNDNDIGATSNGNDYDGDGAMGYADDNNDDDNNTNLMTSDKGDNRRGQQLQSR